MHCIVGYSSSRSSGFSRFHVKNICILSLHTQCTYCILKKQYDRYEIPHITKHKRSILCSISFRTSVHKCRFAHAVTVYMFSSL